MRRHQSGSFVEGFNNVTYRVPLVFIPQPEGGYTVTSPVLPELLTA